MTLALAPGAKAPSFELPDAEGAPVSLAGLKGQLVVLYFYPKDDTTGCTREAIDFTAKAGDFEAAGAIVLGVSKDPPASHKKFIEKHALTVRLLSDEKGAACEAYGVWVEKSMYGRRYMGIERTTYLIDAKGVIRQVWRKVKVPGHADAVLSAVRDL